ncbi:MAG TPA: ferritin-like domain-containing protein [Solirubrobacteraceae bacterium]
MTRATDGAGSGGVTRATDRAGGGEVTRATDGAGGGGVTRATEAAGSGRRVAEASAPESGTRRQLLGGAAVVVTGGSLLASGTPAWALSSPGILSMQAAVRLEQTLAVVYGSLAGRRGLDRELRDLFGLLAEHEHQHAAALLAMVEYLGGGPPALPTLAEAEQAIPAAAAINDRPSALRLAERLENAEVFGFYTGGQTLDDVKLIEISAAVMCSDSQHLVLVRQTAGQNPIPAAFETGRESG